MRIKIRPTTAAAVFFAAIGVSCAVYYWCLNSRPFTQNAFVVTDIQVVSPWVDGYVAELCVRNGQRVKKGDPLLKIFAPPYELKVRELEHALAKTRARHEKLRRRLPVIDAEIRRDEAEFRNRRFLARQALEMYSSDAVSRTYTEEQVRAGEAAEYRLAAVRAALPVLEAEIEEAASEIGEIESRLELARIYRDQTVLRALHDGFVSNMFTASGAFHRAGEALFAVIPDDRWRIQANFEETALSLIRPGQRATVWLWQYPGRRFRGVVESVNYGVERQRSSPRSALQIVEPENQWFMLPQRLPVQIKLLDIDPEVQLTPGASAYVRIEVSSQLVKQFAWRIFRW